MVRAQLGGAATPDRFPPTSTAPLSAGSGAAVLVAAVRLPPACLPAAWFPATEDLIPDPDQGVLQDRAQVGQGVGAERLGMPGRRPQFLGEVKGEPFQVADHPGIWPVRPVRAARGPAGPPGVVRPAAPASPARPPGPAGPVRPARAVAAVSRP